MKKPTHKELARLEEGQRVDLVIGERTGIGYKAIIDNEREGVLYGNEIFQPLRKGQRVSGFIKKVRDDGKIDLCLQRPGPEKVDQVSEKIVGKLLKEGGHIQVGDDSPPEVIYRMFGVSKKTFKKAVGALYKRRVILIDADGIRLTGRTQRK